ncbi:MAG: putative endonuclease [Patescibacteria group bacterium]|jgi:putative endonuclease|nr:putative endonuclease [Patescibacteria group bacterium]
MFYTYVLLSAKDKTYYTGWSTDLKRRVKEHNEGKVDATRNRRPLKLIYYEACLVEEDAVRREKQLKTGFGRAYLRRRLSVI